MIRFIVLTGPTASGKSTLATKLAKSALGGQAEIVSADSRQVYRGLDIGTAKVPISSANQYRGIRHHLIDVASPRKTFTVAQYQKLARKAINNIQKRGKIPMIVGGTGFYIKTLIFNLDLPEVKPNPKLRHKLEKLSAAALFKRLQRLDPSRAESIDKHNQRRLIRALEIIEKLGAVPPPSIPPPWWGRKGGGVLILGLKLPATKLRRQINERVDRRVAGIIKEIKSLRRQGLSFKRLINFGLEYRYFSWYLLGKLSKAEAVAQLKTVTWRFARRQYTYLKRLPVVWISTQKQAEREIKKFLQNQ